MADSERESEPADEGVAPGDGRVEPRLIDVYAQRPDEYDGTCLRPLGLCELGGCCEVCWYRPDHPRFKRG